MKILSNILPVSDPEASCFSCQEGPLSVLPTTAFQIVAYPELIRLQEGQRVKVFDTSLQHVKRRWVQVPLSSLSADQGYLRIEVKRSDGSFGQVYEIGRGGGEFTTALGSELYASALAGAVQLLIAEELF